MVQFFQIPFSGKCVLGGGVRFKERGQIQGPRSDSGDKGVRLGDKGGQIGGTRGDKGGIRDG